MKIILKCPCGGEAVFEDTGIYINPHDCAADEKGRKFILQIQADAWLDRHAECLKAAKERKP